MNTSFWSLTYAPTFQMGEIQSANNLFNTPTYHMLSNMSQPTTTSDNSSTIFSNPKDQVSTSCISEVASLNSNAAFLERLNTEFSIPKNLTHILHEEFLETYKAALKRSKICMIPCFKIPENFNHQTDINGELIVLDLGGSTIRIAIVDLSQRRTPIVTQKQWVLKEDEKNINIEFFEDLVNRAITLAGGVYKDTRKHWNIGVTWSFPLNPKNEIINMGKGFQVDEEVLNIGVDELISQICAKKGFNANVKAIINDSVAVNLSGLINREFDSNVSFILGTGLNSCIIKDHQLYNTELGFFGKLHNISKYDDLMDARWRVYLEPYIRNAVNGIPVFQPLEFLASGRNVSELLRLIIVDLIQEEGLLSSFNIEDFIQPFSLHGSFICLLESTKTYDEIKLDFIKNFNIKLSDEEISLLQSVVDLILERSAVYVTSSIKALAQFVLENEDDYDENEVINVNYIGSFLLYCVDLQRKIEAHSNYTIILNHIDDSSLLGAAVAACIKNHSK